MGSKSRKVATWVVPTAALSLAVGALGAAPANAEPAPDADPSYVVAIGDSYISGEGGTWANKGFHSPKPSTSWTHWWTGQPAQSGGFYSGFVYGDGGEYATKDAREKIDYCHRSAWSPIHGDINKGIEDGVGGLTPMNLACSGATVPSHRGSDATIQKPGVDFGKDGVEGQATMLREEATHSKVKAVVLSVGGNDFGFADIATDCILALTPVIGLAKDKCSEIPKWQDAIKPAGLEKTKKTIQQGIANVVKAMRDAGVDDKDWKLVYQTPPLPLTSGDDIAKSWDEGHWYQISGYPRQIEGGCGVYNQDANWMVGTVYPKLIETMKKAFTDSRDILGDVPVVFVDNTHAFDGHKLCESSIAKINVNYAMTAGYGMSKPGDKPRVPFVSQAATPTANDPLTHGYNGAKAEWITPVILGDQPPLGSDKHRGQNPLHPNFWGQRALSACADLALASDGGKVVKCAQDKPNGAEVLDAKGRPAMKLTATEDLKFATPSAPKIANIDGQDNKLLVNWTPPADPGSAGPITGYEFTTDGGLTWKAVGSATPANPLEITVDSKDETIGNGTPYYVGIRAVNAAGHGTQSNILPGMAAGKPMPPTDVVATPIDFGASIAFTPGDTGGPSIPVLEYRYRVVSPADTWPDDWTTLAGQAEPPLIIDGLEPNVEHKIEIVAVTPGGASDPVEATFVPGPTGSGFVPIAPKRVYDSRTGTPAGPLAAGSHLVKLNADPANPVVPKDATAVVYNVTVTGGTASGYVEVTPEGLATGKTSTINWSPNQTLANAHVVQLDPKSDAADVAVDVSVGSSGTVQVILDIMGYYTKEQPTANRPVATGASSTPVAALFKPLAEPMRVLETRDEQAPSAYPLPKPGGDPYPKGEITGGGWIDLDLSRWFAPGNPLHQVAGKDLCKVGAGGVADEANKLRAVAFNLTVTGTKKSGALAVWGDGDAPSTSIINWTEGNQTLANGAIATVGSDCMLRIKNVGNGPASQAHVMLDITGVFAANSADFEQGQMFFPIEPIRTYDSRDEEGPLTSADYREHEFADQGSIPEGAQAIAYNLTITGNKGSGFFSLAPGSVTELPKASVINWNALPGSVTRANGGIVGTTGEMAQANAFVGGSGSTEYLLDAAGYFKTDQPTG